MQEYVRRRSDDARWDESTVESRGAPCQPSLVQETLDVQPIQLAH